MAKIAGGCGKAFEVKKGLHVKIINTHGSQVVDTWAFNINDMSEFLSTQHNRSCLEKLTPTVGDYIFSNKRRPIFKLIEDTSPGVHDMLLSACDIERYRLLGCKDYHKNCADNFKMSLLELGYKAPQLPSPWNVFENVTLGKSKSLKIQSPPVKAGDYILLRAEIDLITILSSCPMDIALTNGPNGIPQEVEYQIINFKKK